MYLYCEEKNIAFYERFGFRRTYEYRCTKKVNITNQPTVESIPMNSKEEWLRMVDIIQRRGQYGERVMVGNTGLMMFYLSGPFSEYVYYVPSSEAYVVAGVEGDLLTLYAIFSDEKIGLGDIISSFGSGISRVNMAFCPENNTGFEIKKIESETGESATDERVAKELGLTDNEYADWQSQMAVTNVISLDEFNENSTEDGSGGRETIADNSAGPEEVLEEKELKKTLADALELLTEKERKVIVLYYYEELTLKEISNILEVSESRVSQLHIKGLAKMKTKLGKYMDVLGSGA